MRAAGDLAIEYSSSGQKTLSRVRPPVRAPDETVSALSTHLFDRTDMCTAVICWQGNRVLSENHFQQVVLSPSCLQSFALDAHFQTGFPLQQVVGYLP